MKELKELVKSGRISVESVKKWKKADFVKHFEGRLKNPADLYDAAKAYKE